MYSLPPTQGQKIIILYWSGQNFKIITSAKHKGYISVWPECVAQGFQTLFVMREERFKRYKNQQDKSFNMLHTHDQKNNKSHT